MEERCRSNSRFRWRSICSARMLPSLRDESDGIDHPVREISMSDGQSCAAVITAATALGPPGFSEKSRNCNGQFPVRTASQIADTPASVIPFDATHNAVKPLLLAKPRASRVAPVSPIADPESRQEVGIMLSLKDARLTFVSLESSRSPRLL
jgi:hypothetical protein